MCCTLSGTTPEGIPYLSVHGLFALRVQVLVCTGDLDKAKLKHASNDLRLKPEKVWEQVLLP